MDDQDEDDFNIIQPTLIQQLKKILDEYPDDGQILKELIQNAEDARATKVKFLFDKSSYNTASLYCPELEKFQGPALYAYNDAIFTPDDWKGVRMLSDSIKAKDPMKVGRFGLGFKSVFHMTDLPSVLSDQHIGMIDPHEKYFKDSSGRCGTGRRWKLNDPETRKFQDQFQPYKDLFGSSDETFKAGKYRGTFFRFPLRQEESVLSDTVYSTEKMMLLFEHFQTEAQFTVLFLKRLESIELFVRNEKGQAPEKLFQVRIVNTELVRSKREEFLRGIAGGTAKTKPVTVTYPITIETAKFNKGSGAESIQHSFLVTDYYAGGKTSTRLEELTKETSLSYLPWVGVALPVPSKGDDSAARKDVNINSQPSGHLFCFLPLPLERKSLTGLPVHVNGFFALSQNRRHLKWPSADQDDSVPLTDKALLWNMCLLEDVVPKAYTELVKQAAEEFMGTSNFPSEQDVYRAWPDVLQVDTKWRKMVELFFKEIFLENVLYTAVDKGKWIKICEAIIERPSETANAQEVVKKVLLHANMNIVTVPNHVMEAITTFYTSYSAVVEPNVVRQALRSIYDIYPGFDRTEKLKLLDYILKDENFVNLYDIQLLPLSDGSFSNFDWYKDDENAIFISSDEHPQTLLPGLENSFLDETIGTETICQLKNIADQECLQLRHLNKDVIKRWLHRVVPTQGSRCGHRVWYLQKSDYRNPPNGWLEEVWTYLGKQFDDLKEFHHLPLIQVEVSSETVILAELESPSTLVVREINGVVLDSMIVRVLRVLGLTVIEELPSFISSHPSCFQYIQQPTLPAVLKALQAVSTRKAVPNHFNLQECSEKEKRALRSFLSKVTTVDNSLKEILRVMPLFETVEGSGGHASHFVAPVNVNCAAPEEVLPVRLPVSLLDVTDEDSKRLAQVLEVKLLKTTELLQSIVFPNLLNGKYSEDEVDKLMVHILQRVALYSEEDTTFLSSLKSLPFVLNGTGSARVKVSELFDPNSESLQNIFFGEPDHFPSRSYQDVTVNGVMLNLGLKKENAVTAVDILESVKLVAKLEDVTKARIKSEAILHYLDRKPTTLQECVPSGSSLLNALQQIRWLVRARGRPAYYPVNLSLYQADNSPFEKPLDLILNTKKLVSLVGTVRPTVQELVAPNLARLFGWDNDPSLEEVVINLRNVASSFVPEEKANFMSLITEIYRYLSSMSPSVIQATLQNFGVTKWIWNGDGFSSPNEIILHKAFTDFAPYVYELPREVNQYSKLFQDLGVRSEQDPELLVQVLHMIKEKYENIKNEERTTVKHDLQLSISILNELTSNGDNDLTPDILEHILIPTNVEDDATLLLAPIEDCTYCDTEWLKVGAEVSEVEEDDDVTLKYVHRNISRSTAESLGVPTLMSRILDPDQLGLGEEFGQYEPLTRRLNRLLEDYTDGFAVPKELIQNADDAGATEIKLMYDERSNEDARTCLIDDGMKEWQGPALWAYNNATFSDADFENITKLNGATKENDSEKIGRFGLGFNAVYNLTDVPSFISRNNIVIFDPHITHLGKAIRDKSKPGLKFDLTKPKFKRTLKKLQSQFKPYNGVFGCDLSPESNCLFYDGTLFRFPLRNRSQAIRSEIKNLHYDDLQMKELLEILVRGSESLLLFTQNVLKVTVYHLPQERKDASQPIELFQVVKKPIQILQTLELPLQLSPSAIQLAKEERSFVHQCNFLKALTQVLRKNKEKAASLPETLESSMIIEMVSTLEDGGHQFFSEGTRMEVAKAKPWLVFSCRGSDMLLQQASKDQSLRPSAGVAIRLEVNGTKFLPRPIVNSCGQALGSIFCFLPLPVRNGLPIHINGGFAVTSNRRHLKERTEDDKQEIGADWNKLLLQDAVCKAYLRVLEECGKVLSLNSDTVPKFYQLWPTVDCIEANCAPLLQSFYECVLALPCLPRLFTDGEHWVDIRQVLFMDSEFRNDARIGDVAFRVLKQCKRIEKVVVDLPDEIFQSFRKSSIPAKTFEVAKVSKQRFFEEFFFPNIKSIDPHLRDSLTLYALNEDDQELNEALKQTPCIPVSPDGVSLKRPCEVIYPNRETKLLYELGDKKFPHGTESTFLSKHCLMQLNQLGMKDTKDLLWEDIFERTTTVEALMYRSHERALQRIKVLIDLMCSKLEPTRDECQKKVVGDVSQHLLEVRFLPFMAKPRGFPLKWKGDDMNNQNVKLAAAKDLYPKKSIYKVCCSQLILDESVDEGCGTVPERVKIFLKIQEKKVKLADVWQQLEIAIETKLDMTNSGNKARSF